MITLPESWSDWEIMKALGAGSYANVYEAARRDNPSIRAAIKVIAIPHDAEEQDELISEGFSSQDSKSFFDEAVQDFIHEVKIMDQFKGMQNIVSIEDYKVVPKEDGIGSYIFIRMELLTSLENYLSDKKLSEQEVLKLGMDICSALVFCAEKNIIHRDIKPANIFVNEKIPSRVFYKLGDFGIARSLEHRSAGLSSKGTPYYIAPEVAAAKPYDARADIYSLGLTMYRLLNMNRLPFFPHSQLYMPQEKQDAIRRRLAGEKIEPPVEASPEAAQIILKACSYDPEDRFKTAEEMRSALAAVLGKPKHPDPPAAPAEQPVLPEAADSGKEAEENTVQPKRNKLFPLFLLVLLAALCCVGFLFFRNGGVLRRSPSPAPTASPALPSAAPTPFAAGTEKPANAAPVSTETPAATAAVFLTIPVYYAEENGKVISQQEYVISYNTIIMADHSVVGPDYTLISPAQVTVSVSSGAASPASVTFRYQKNATASPTVQPTASPTPAPTLPPTAAPAAPTAAPFALPFQPRTALTKMEASAAGCSLPFQKYASAPDRAAELKEHVGRMIVITAKSARARMDAGTEFSYLETIQAGEAYEILDAKIGTDGGVWYQILANGKMCWISSALASFQ